jgi:hypothetical protein
MFNGLDICTATGDTPSVGRHDFCAMTIYRSLGLIHTDDDITGHLSGDFYSIWNNSLVGINSLIKGLGLAAVCVS